MPDGADRQRARPRAGPLLLPHLLRDPQAAAADHRRKHVRERELSDGAAWGGPGRGRRRARLVGLTVLTKIGLGLIAVGIGFLVGHGAARGAGGKRSVGLQALSVAVGAVAFLVAAYLVNMTFINQALAQQGRPVRVPFPPASLGMFFHVLAANFGVMKLVFLAIVVYEAWIIPRPVKLPA